MDAILALSINGRHSGTLSDECHSGTLSIWTSFRHSKWMGAVLALWMDRRYSRTLQSTELHTVCLTPPTQAHQVWRHAAVLREVLPGYDLQGARRAKHPTSLDFIQPRSRRMIDPVPLEVPRP